MCNNFTTDKAISFSKKTRSRGTLHRYYALTMLFLFAVMSGFAQQFKITGKVVDKGGVPLVGVNVLVKETTRGVSTDFDGMYSIAVKQGDVITYSFVGFNTKTITVGADRTIDVVLEPSSTELEGVVLTGYRKIKANEFAGASVKLSADKVKIGGVASIDNLLQGQAAGVSVQSASSVFGTAPKIRIRGSSSITGINEPLWVLDGVVLQNPVPIEPSALYSGSARTLLGSALGGVNPDDIQDITVLKDATATALYGSRAVNGVIVITTKRGTRNQKLSVSYNNSTTYSLKPSANDFDILNSQDEVNIREQLFTIYENRAQDFSANNQGAYAKLLDQRNRRIIDEAGFRQGLKRIKDRNTDWFDVLFRNSIQQQHSVSASYGGKNSESRLSFSYLHDDGYQRSQNLSRYTVNASNKIFFSDKFSGELLFKHASRKQRNPGIRVNPFRYARLASRSMAPYDEQGNLEFYKKDYADFNIIKELDNDYIDIKAQDLTIQLQFEYKPIEALNITVLANRTSSNSNVEESQTENSSYANSFRVDEFKLLNRVSRLYKDPTKPANALPETILPVGGFLNVSNIRTETTTFRAQADYEVFKNSTHRLGVFAGLETIQSETSENRFRGIGYIFSSGTSAPSELALQQSIRSRDRDDRYYSTHPFRRNQLSYYGSLDYTLLKRYILTASLRNDANNILSGGKSGEANFLPTWTVAGAWQLGKEPFMDGVSHVFTSLKLRGSYGLRGNAGNRGTALLAYYGNAARAYPSLNEIGIQIREPENVDLDYEKEYILSAGIDMSLFDKVSLSLDYYHRKNFDLVGYRPVAPSSGYYEKQLNWATMTNEGFEASININPIVLAKDFTWSGNFNIGYNKNTILSNYIGNSPTLRTATESNGYPFQGRPLTGLYAYKLSRLNEQGLPLYLNGQGEEVYGFTSGDKDYESISYQGSRDPLYSGGFSSNFKYKSFTFGTTFVFNSGNVVRKNSLYSSNSLETLFRDDLNITGDYANRWQGLGNEQYTNIPRLFDETDEDFYANEGIFLESAFRNYNRSDTRTINASFLRVRNVSLKYSFPKKLVKDLRLSYLNAEVQATNVAVFASKKLRGQDPESFVIEPGTTRLTEGSTNLPPVKSVTLNISLGF